MKRHPKCVACQPKIKSFFEKNKFEYAGAAGGYIDIYGFHFCRGRIFDSIEEDLGQYDDERRIFWGCGVCLLVNKDFFIKAGMFDEDFFMYGEETDFCWRANIYGKEIWFCPKSIIYHVGSFSVGKEKVNLKKDYLISKNHITLLLKNYSTKNLIKLLPMRIILECISAIRFFPDKTIAALMAFFALPFEYIFKIKSKRKEIQSKRKLSDKDIANLIYQRSIALDYFLKGKNKFSKLKL